MEETPSTVSCMWKDHFISGLAVIRHYCLVEVGWNLLNDMMFASNL